MFFLHAIHHNEPFSLPFVAAVLASVMHVISGPDHLAAVTPMVIDTKKKAWKIGLSWGVGHISGMLFIGLLFLFFKDLIPIDAISKYSEQLVALVLIGVGLWSFFVLFKESKNHKHPHIHVSETVYIHVHQHEHRSGEQHNHTHADEVRQTVFSVFWIGFLHGLAGVAHFVLLLPVLGFKNQGESVQYITGFALGTILAMTVYALVLGRLAHYIKTEHNEVFFKGIRLAGGLFAVIIGLYWLFLTF